LHENAKKIKEEEETVVVLTQFHACKLEIEKLNEQKPKGFKAIFKGESQKNQQSRKALAEHLKALSTAMGANNLFSDNFKDKVQHPDQIKMGEIKEEMTHHENTLTSINSATKHIREEIFNLSTI
jgi:hypothetical protein